MGPMTSKVRWGVCGAYDLKGRVARGVSMKGRVECGSMAGQVSRAPDVHGACDLKGSLRFMGSWLSA
jgi:hypothetical protein